VVAGSGSGLVDGLHVEPSRPRDRRSEPGQDLCTSPEHLHLSAGGDARIPVKGQPNKMTLNKAQTLLYVAEDESDTVDVIDLNPADIGNPSQNQPATVNTVIESIPVIAPPAGISVFSLTQYTGANTNSVTLSPDENASLRDQRQSE
jgi:DNA-binding beta-propeller fold protein YncE